MDPFMYPDEFDAHNGAGLSGIEGLNMAQLFDGSEPPWVKLQKALTAGEETQHTAMVGGGAFRRESLEASLKNLIFADESCVLANDLLTSKIKADSTVVEAAFIESIGEASTFTEGGAPAQEDDDYSRKVTFMKYIGAICQVTNPMRYVKGIVEPMERENRAKTLAIRKKLNIDGYFGNQTLVSTQFNGIVTATIASGLSDNVIDKRGKRLTIEDWNKAINVIENVMGFTSNVRAYLSPTAKRNYKDELLAEKRYIVAGSRVGNVDQELEGLKANKLLYDGGEMPLRVDMFLNPIRHPRRNLANDAFIATGDKTPAVPTVTSVTPTALGSGDLAAGTYDYALVAVNKYGYKSTPSVVAATQDVAVNAGEKVVFVTADGGSASGDRNATAIEVYRRISTATLDTDYRYLFTAPIGTFADDGQNLPDTGYAVVLPWDTDQVLALHQLLDLAKWPLATSIDSIIWMIRLYCTLFVYNPKKIVVFKNVGSIPN